MSDVAGKVSRYRPITNWLITPDTGPGIPNLHHFTPAVRD
jgi:hypothetical protein